MSSSEEASEGPVNPLGVGAAAVAVVAWGLAAVVVKNIDLGSLAIASYRFAIYSITLVVFLALRKTPVTTRVLRESFRGGVALGLQVALFFSAVKLTSVANATVIGSLQPIVVAIVAARLFGERIDHRSIGLGLVAIAGAITVVLAGANGEESAIAGDLLATAALALWAGYFVFSREAKEKITPQEYTVGASIWTALINIPLAIAFGQDLSWPSTPNWVWLIVLAFGSGLLGHSTMNWSIQQIPLWISSTFTLLIPVISTIAAWVFLDEALTGLQIIAIIVVVSALTGIVAGQSGSVARPRPRILRR